MLSTLEGNVQTCQMCADALEEKVLNMFGKLGGDISPEPAMELAKKVQQ